MINWDKFEIFNTVCEKKIYEINSQMKKWDKFETFNMIYDKYVWNNIEK